MRRMQWRDGVGVIASGEGRMTLIARPPLSFAFDAIDVRGADGELELAGTRRALTAAELAEVTARCAQLDGANTAARVHGADADGRYLGLVVEAVAAHVLDGPPPFGVAEAVFDPARRTWRREMPVARLKAEVRRQRTALLLSCDWTQTTDSPLAVADRQAWRAYRQALRDLPEHPKWPTLDPADWPPAPSAAL